jgi:hypothetical protein
MAHGKSHAMEDEILEDQGLGLKAAREFRAGRVEPFLKVNSRY